MYRRSSTRQRLEDVGDVGGMQSIQLALEQRAVLLGDERLDQARALRVGRVRGLLVDQPFYEPVLAKERGDVGERILDAPGRLGPVGRLFVEGFGHGRGVLKGSIWRRRARAHFTRRNRVTLPFWTPARSCGIAHET